MVSQPHAFSWSDHGASEMKKRSINGQFVLVSHHEAFESADPSDAFPDDPPLAAVSSDFAVLNSVIDTVSPGMGARERFPVFSALP